MHTENYKDIPGFSGEYQVSDKGRVVSLKYGRYRELKPDLAKGYLRVTLSKQNIQSRFQVHRLVAQAFIPNSRNKPHVNHLNGDKTDNRKENLQWCTPSENEIHSYKDLGKVNHNRKFSEEEVDDIRENCQKASGPFMEDGNVPEYADKYNVSPNTIHNILNEKCYG